jgi:predicted RNase H-like HicB family nuclease
VSKEEALINIREAIRVYIAVLQDDNISVPEEHFDVLLAVV